MSIVLDKCLNENILKIEVLSFAPFSKSFMDKLTKRNIDDLDAKNIGFYLTFLLLEHYSARINFHNDHNCLTIIIKI